MWSLVLNVPSTELARTSSPQICTWLRTAYVGLRCDVCSPSLYSPRRSCAGSLCQNVVDHGSFTTSSLRTALRIRPIRWAFIRLRMILDLTTRIRFPSLSRNAGGGSMALSSPHYMVLSSSTIFTVLRTALRASSGYISNSSTKLSISSFLGLPS